jgi:hypothetical protein
MVVVRLVTIGPKGRAAAPTGKDADPQECPWHFKCREAKPVARPQAETVRSLSVIDVRHFGSIVAGRATSLRRK